MAGAHGETPCRREYRTMIFALIIIAIDLIFLKIVKRDWFENQYIFYAILAAVVVVGIGASFQIARYYQCLISYNKSE